VRLSDEMTDDAWEHMLQVDLTGVMRTLSLARAGREDIPSGRVGRRTRSPPSYAS